MPVAHADVDGQRETACGQLRLERLRLSHGQLGERGYAAEEVVVMRNLLDALRTDAAPAQHVLEEWTHIRRALGTTERDEEHGIERRRHAPPIMS